MIVLINDMKQGDILAGAKAGRALFASCVAKTETEPDEPAACFLDFTGIRVATARALLDSVIAFKTWKRSMNSKYYPLVSNINRVIEDELELLLEMRGDAIMCCDMDMNDILSRHGVPDRIDHFNVRLLGHLDPKQALAFDLVNRLGGAGPATLLHHPDNNETVGITAWNNRLADLVKRGLLREFSMGRAKSYQPLPGTESFKSIMEGNNNDKPAGN